MKNENIPQSAKSKSIKDIKDEINHILAKLENKDTDLSDSINDYQRLIGLNKQIENIFKKRNKEISAIGKKIKESL